MRALEQRLIEDFYKPLYFNKLSSAEQRQGNRFLITPCPEKVEIVFLNDNPGPFLGNEVPNKASMPEECPFWFEEDWGKSNGKRECFRRAIYLISRKSREKGWTYSRQFYDLKNEISNIPAGYVLGAYAIPLRTESEKDLTDRVENLSRCLWTEIFNKVLKPKNIFATGKKPYDMICDIFGVRKEKDVSVSSGWGSVKFQYRDAGGTKIIFLPQMTRFRLFCSEKENIVAAIDDLMDRVF